MQAYSAKLVLSSDEGGGIQDRLVLVALNVSNFEVKCSLLNVRVISYLDLLTLKI